MNEAIYPACKVCGRAIYRLQGGRGTWSHLGEVEDPNYYPVGGASTQGSYKGHEPEPAG